MKKFILAFSAFLILCPKSYAASDNIALLEKQGFFDRPAQECSLLSPTEEVRKIMYQHLKYANSYNFDGLSSLYADNYTNTDGLNKKIYFDLIKKTWDNYPDIKYKITIKNIEIDGDSAIAQVSENAIGNTNAKSGIINEKGLLESVSDSVYYLTKINNKWLITSDHILFEKTFLRYGSAKITEVDLSAPPQIPADTSYTASLKINQPKDSLVIGSIGRENITFPQITADEVFRKMPDDGVLERMFKANTNNINEYAVASFGITKAEIGKGMEVRVYVTGLGFVMSRVNVIPKNDFIKVADNEKTK